MNGEDYSRFCVPVLRCVDESVEDDEQYQTPRMRELAPFLYRGSDPWPFKYQIKQKGERE